jgi:hypothetical protein
VEFVMRLLSAALALAILAAGAAPAAADAASEAIERAAAAYAEGRLREAIAELQTAQVAIQQQQTGALAALLPEAPAGFTREISTDLAAGLAMMGGGVGAEATYASASDRFTVTVTVDNPMIAMFAGMFANPQLIAMMGGEALKIGGRDFVSQDGQVTGLIDFRILIQAQGAPVEVMSPVLEAIDYAALGRFGL